MGVTVREKVKGSGEWWLFVNHRGRRKAKYVGKGSASKRAADTAKGQIEAKLTLGDLSPLDPAPAGARTLSAFAAQWLTSDVALRLKPASQETYEQVLRLHIGPQLGSQGLATLTREHIKAFIANRTQAGLGPDRVQLALAVLSGCLNAAVDAGLIPSNPALRLGRYTRNPNAPLAVIEIFSPAEIAQLLETAKAQRPTLYPLLLTLARTGLRIGEALTLQVGDIDLTRRELWVRRSWGSSSPAFADRQIGTPKSRRLRRVDLSRQLCEALRTALALREAEGILAGRSLAPSDWLFPGPGGTPLTRNMFQPRWRRLLRVAGIRRRKAHTLRHTYASQLIQNGESLAYVRDQLGHHSIKLTVDTYGHLIPGANKAAVDRLDPAPDCNLGATALREDRVSANEVR
jgi:integrase